MKTKKYITQYEGIDMELFFCSELLKLESLHYGYWNPGEELTLSNVRIAQKRYTDTLVNLIPKGVKTILDVGCGIGDVSKAAAKKGYSVTAISPDKNQGKYFPKNDKNLQFTRSKFEEFNSNKKFDLILMSESQNYFYTDIGFQKCLKLLKPKGHLLVSGLFSKSKDDHFGFNTSIKKEYLDAANEHGFNIKKSIDISKQTLPTLTYTHRRINEYVVPTTQMIEHYLYATSPVKTKIMKVLFNKQIKDMKKVYEFYNKVTDPKIFKAKAEYLRFLFQRNN
ncbi:MAG: class I SAM-dependent methyltransferase [Nanoarchaeota archaeon]|nr:class I SAM-dependent methyltransferase [Nanoarchaeota archaeon]